jgi:hypothetical protein
MRTLTVMWAVILAAMVSGCIGCAPNTEAMERAVNTLVIEVIRPAVEKAAGELASRSAALQGQGSLINPGYVVEGYAIAGTGAAWTFTIRAEGISANLAGATQADQGPDLEHGDDDGQAGSP